MHWMITGTNQSETLTEHISCENKCRFDRRKCNLHQWGNNDKCWSECKKCHICEKIMFGILLHANMKMENLLASIMDDSAINCDEIIESYDEETNFNERKQPSKCKVSIFFALLLITVELLIAVSIYCYLIKYQAKLKQLIPYHEYHK